MKAATLDYLKSVSKVDRKKSDPYDNNIYETDQTFLEEEDFEAIFDSMDNLETGVVPRSYLEHALNVVGVKNGAEVLK